MNPVEVIQELLGYFEIQIHARNIKVSVEYEKDDGKEFPEFVVCDEMRFKEITFHII